MKFAIDAGHGLYTAGKRCLASIDPDETREWSLNCRVADYVCEYLAQLGISTLRVDNTTGVTDVALSSRTTAANNANVDAYISIHHNAGINGGSGGGPVVYVYNGQHSAVSDEMQTAIYAEVIAQTGYTGNRASPMTSANLYVLRKTNMPAVLIECGFMDSTTDVPLILSDEYAKGCALGIVTGLASVFDFNVSTLGVDDIEAVSVITATQDMQEAEEDSDIPTGYVAQFQTWLNTNYAAGLDVDGIQGSKTKAGATKALQTELNTQFSAGLDVDGKFGPKTKAACVNVKQGAKGNMTRTIQGLLYGFGYDPNGFDGSFGPGCLAAVKSYQTNKGLSVDGIVGPNTWAAMLG